MEPKPEIQSQSKEKLRLSLSFYLCCATITLLCSFALLTQFNLHLQVAIKAKKNPAHKNDSKFLKSINNIKG